MTEVWASSPPAKHCRDPGTFDADEALAMSLGLSARGNRTRPLAVKAKYRTSSPRIACTPGNIRDGFTPCGESHALPLSYGRARAPPGGFEPPTLRLPMQPISSPPANRFGLRDCADDGSSFEPVERSLELLFFEERGRGAGEHMTIRAPRVAEFDPLSRSSRERCYGAGGEK